MTARQPSVRQLVEACLRNDEQKEESSEANTNEPVLTTIPTVCDKELDLAIKFTSNQIHDKNLFDLPDTFKTDCSLDYPAKQIIFSNNTGDIIDNVVPEELSLYIDNNTNKQQEFGIIRNDSQGSDKTMPHYNSDIVTALKHTPHNIFGALETKSLSDNNSKNINEIDRNISIHNAADDDENNERVKRPSRGRKRKIADQNRDIRKKRTNTNQDYVSAKGKLVNSRIFTGHNYDCGCPKQCTEKISADERENEFKMFWSAGSFEARCALLQRYVKESDKKRSYSLQSKRKYTRKYYMRDKEICKKTLLNTLNISQARIDSLLTKNRNNELLRDKRGEKAGGKNAITVEQLKEMRDSFERLPRYKSHYCNESSAANYLAPNLNLVVLYEIYNTNRKNSVSFSRFRQFLLKDFNLKFKKPQKGTCLRCDVFQAKITSATSEQKTILEDQHKQHLDYANSLSLQMKADLLAAKTDESTETLTFDLGKTHSLPQLPTSVVYFKRQLNLYNLGIHSGSTGQAFFYVWLEHEAGRGTQEIGSCLRKFIKEKLKPGVTHLILWSDSCGGQNRSINMVIIMLHILQIHDTLEKVTLRFLQPCHTFLPNDSEFGDVERVLKKQSRLYTAEDFIEVMENCRRKNKFEVTKVTKNDFFSIGPILRQITKRTTNVHKEKVSWLKTHEIQLKKNEPTTLYMKTNLSYEATTVDIGKGTIKRRKPINFNIDLPLLHPEGRELSNDKVKDLKEVLKLVPIDAKPFYNFVKTVKGGNFDDDVEGFGSTLDFKLEDETLCEEGDSAREK